MQLEGGRLGVLLGETELPDTGSSHNEKTLEQPSLNSGEPSNTEDNSKTAAQNTSHSTKEPTCIISTKLACALFGSEHAIGKKVIYQGTAYAILQAVPCEMPILFLGKRTDLQNKEAQGTETSLAISLVQGKDSLSFRKTEYLFAGCDAAIDMSLLKWAACLAVSLCPFGFLALLPAQAKKARIPCLLIWICYLKLEVFSSAGPFPIWALPGKWSDLEGWGSLWDSIAMQVSALFQFRDYPILHGYFQNLSGCLFYFLLCFFSLLGFIKLFSSSGPVLHNKPTSTPQAPHS